MTLELVCNVHLHRLLYDPLRDTTTKEAMNTIYLVINLPWWCMLAFFFAAPCSSDGGRGPFSSDGSRGPFGSDGGRGPLGHNCKIPTNVADVKMVQHLFFPAMIS